MPTLNLGLVSPGFFNDGDLEINGEQLGALEVLAADSDNALADAISGFDNLTATVSETGELVIEWSGVLSVDGQDPTGGGAINDLQAGSYE
jgi:hypothetical protein